MEFRKKITTNLYARQQKRHRCKEQIFGLWERKGWDDLREEHWNMHITMCKVDDQCKFDAWSRALKASALGQPRGVMWGERWDGGSGWGDTCALMADSCLCMAKTTAIVYSSYPPIKINYFFKLSIFLVSKPYTHLHFHSLYFLQISINTVFTFLYHASSSEHNTQWRLTCHSQLQCQPSRSGWNYFDIYQAAEQLMMRPKPVLAES